MEKLFTFQELCGVLLMKPATFYGLLSRGEIAYLKTNGKIGSKGGRLPFREVDLQAWIN
jgi:hypothetical protein